MKKIELTQEQEDALSQHSQSGAKGIVLIKKIFEHYTQDLADITNIDMKGNLGLQTLARSTALDTIKEMQKLIFPEMFVAEKKNEDTPVSQWR